jgi:hypothetical protein
MLLCQLSLGITFLVKLDYHPPAQLTSRVVLSLSPNTVFSVQLQCPVSPRELGWERPRRARKKQISCPGHIMLVAVAGHMNTSHWEQDKDTDHAVQQSRSKGSGR